MNHPANTSSTHNNSSGNTAPTSNVVGLPTSSFENQTAAGDTNNKINNGVGLSQFSMNNISTSQGGSFTFDPNSGLNTCATINPYDNMANSGDNMMLNSDNIMPNSLGNTASVSMRSTNDTNDMNFFNQTSFNNYPSQQRNPTNTALGLSNCSSNGNKSGSNSSCANPVNSNSTPGVANSMVNTPTMNLGNVPLPPNNTIPNPSFSNNDTAQHQGMIGIQQPQLPPPQQQGLSEKIQMVVMQIAQLKGQIAAGQNNLSPQNKDIVTQMILRLNQLQEVYLQLVNAQQQQQQQQQQAAQIRQLSMMNNPMINANNPNMNIVNALQAQQQQNQMMEQQQQQKQTNVNNIRAMQALQQRMMAIQMMNNQRLKMQFMNNMPGQIPPYMLQQHSANQQNLFRMMSPKQQPNLMINNNQIPFNPNFQQQMFAMSQMQNMPNMVNMVGINAAAAAMNRMPYHQANMQAMSHGGSGGGRASLPTTGRRRRRRSDTESSDFSSSPEPTRKEIDELANMAGPLRRSTRAKKPKNYAFDFDFDDGDTDGVEKVKNEDGDEHTTADAAGASGSVDKSNVPELIPVQMTHINDNNVAVIDKILADRIRQPKASSLDNSLDNNLDIKSSVILSTETTKTNPNNLTVPASVTSDGLGEEEFYVKYKYYSYLHCEWLTLEEMKLKDRLAINKVKRYKQRKSENIWQFTMEDEYFNPDYIEVDRILAKTVTDYIPEPKTEEEQIKTEPTAPAARTSFADEHNNDYNDGTTVAKTEDANKNAPIVITHYLVKWSSLPYEDSTWEPEDLIDDDVIQQYEEREKSLTAERSTFVQRPNMSSWSELPKSPIYKENNSLREYQLEGLNWLRFCYYRWQNCILADEMGLGKTIQSIALVHDVYNLGVRGPFLIIAPLSTIHNWYREFKTWTDLNVIMFHGTAHSRNIIHKYELFYHDKNGQIVPNVYKFDALITTYEMILSELKFLSSVRWRVAVVDEAHRLKNKKCKLLESLGFLQIEHRVLLTGTPLQNSLEELYSLLSFLDPQNIPSEQAFMEEFGNLQSNDQVSKLQRVLKPIMLRRLKEDVEKNIAPKEETIIEVEMTSIQRRIYKSILEKNFSFLAKGTSTSNMPNLMNTMMELRKCCNHPFLIKGCEEKITSDFSSHSNDDMAAYHLRSLIESSGKLVLVDKLLPKLKANGHRVLLFSQMVKVLDIIEDYLLQKKYLYERIDGSIRGNLRQAAIDRFSRPDSDRFIFLLCTKAGGLGINLTAADTVIIFDSDWNPQNDIQAQARCHRIGQSKSVKVYRLICRNSYEREMFDRASLKLGLDKAVLQSINNSSSNTDQPLAPSKSNEKQQLSKHDIEDLLKRGAYGALMDEDTAESAQFCAEDIDQILERRATVVQIAGEGQGSTFAKASFQANKKDDIDVDDPLFWEKWAQKAKVSLDKSNDLVFDTPRERKVINYDDADSYHTDMESDVDHEDFTQTHHALVSSSRTNWLRVECFKVEKQLLIFGWGRWEVVTLYANFKTLVTYDDVLQIARCILVYCWHFAKVDASTKNFIEGIIKNSFAKGGNSKNDDNDDFNYKPYVKTRSSRRQSGKRSKRSKEKQPPCAVEVSSDWKDCDPDLFILDPGYRKHLQHNANKILLRIRLLYVLQNEIIGKTDDLIMNGGRAEDIQLLVTLPKFSDNSSLASWWNEQCDKSLLIGTYKHGYEKYKEMLLDTQLVFHELIPEEKLTQFIKQQEEQIEAQLNKQIAPSTNVNPEEGPKRRGRKRKRVNVVTKSPQPKRNTRNANSIGVKERVSAADTNNNGATNLSVIAGDMSDFNSDEDRTTQEGEDDMLIDRETSNPPTSQIDEDTANNAIADISDEWPPACYLNTRFRRLVTSFWKNKNSQDPLDKSARKQKSRSATNVSPTSYSGGPISMYDIKLSKKEENEFFKMVIQFGLEFDPTLSNSNSNNEPNNAIFSSKHGFIWDRIRCFKPFEKRTDEQLTMFAKYLVFSCVYVLYTLNELNPTPSSLEINPNSLFSFSLSNLPEDFKPMDGLSADKAIKLLNRVDLLEVLRNKVLKREDVTEKLYILPTDSLHQSDMPNWWVSGSHDYMLLKIIERYGIVPGDRQIFFDIDFDLHKVLIDAYEKARESQWVGFIDQYSSVNDLTYDMICSIIRWPKQRVIMARVHKLLYFVVNGVWPSKPSDCEERYRQIARPTANSIVLSSNTIKNEILDIQSDTAHSNNPLNIPQETSTAVYDKPVTENAIGREADVLQENSLQETAPADNSGIASRQCF